MKISLFERIVKMVMGASAIVASMGLPIASASAAPGITPVGLPSTNTPFIASGGATIVKGGSDIWNCTVALYMNLDASMGGTPPRAAGGQVTGGASYAGSNCSALSVLPDGPVGYSITSANSTGGAGVVHGFTILKNGAQWCTSGADVPFTFLNETTGPSLIKFQTAPIGSTCTLSGNFSTGPDMNVVS